MNTQPARWDCPNCGRKGLPDSKTVCSACQTPRPVDVKFYTPEETGKENLSSQGETKEKKTIGCSAFVWGFGLAILLIIAVIFFPTIKKTASSLFNKVDSLFSKNIQAVVAGFKWERTAYLYEEKEVTDEGWTVPEGGTLIESFQVVHRKEKVHKGYREGQRTVKVKTADGKYEERTETYREEVIEEVPVYKKKYKYRILRWVRIEELKTSGQHRKPYWPTDARAANIKRYKISSRREKFFITIKLPAGTTADAEVSKPVWDDAAKGQDVHVLKHGISGKYTIIAGEIRK